MKKLAEINHLDKQMYIHPEIYKQVMTTREVQETFLATDNFIMACEHAYGIRVINLGAGMKEVSLKRKEY